MKKTTLILISVLCSVKLAIQFLANFNYGFHRDELLHLSVGRHLDWGFMEFPPMIALIGKIAHFLFGYTLFGTRFFASLAGAGILLLACLMAKELGGKLKAIALSGLAILAFLPFYRNHTLFQPVVFDQFFWTLGFYFLIRYLNMKRSKFLVGLGMALGLGLMNKYTMAVWGLGIFSGLLLFQTKAFRNPWLYGSAILAFLIFLPNLIWQMVHHFPVLAHLQKLKESQLDENGPFDFGLEQLHFPFTLALSLVAMAGVFMSAHLKKYKSVAAAVMLIFATMWLLQSKAYYFFGAYPVLFALGAVSLEHFFREKPVLIYACMAVLLLPSVYFIPKAAPVLPIASFVKYANIEPDASGHYELTDDYADMFGWEEQVKSIDSLYRSLPSQDRKNCRILAGNYGEAGAIEILGEKYGLPEPVSHHGSFWLWGSGKTSGETCISVGNKKEVVAMLYQEFTLIKTIRHPFAIAEENNIPLYLCRKPKLDLKALWPKLESRIFD